MLRFYADLHVHTALSPCADEAMTPAGIVRAGRAAGLDMIAVCDHNSAGNVRAVQEAAGGTGLCVIAGMEITTAEEVHVVSLFPDAEAAERAAEAVLASLPRWADGSRFGPQTLLDAAGDVIGAETRILSAASAFSLDAAVSLIKRHGGIAVAAHADRPAFSVTSQLGFFPREAGFDAIEISVAGWGKPIVKELAGLGLPLLFSSDAHFPDAVGAGRTELTMLRANFHELILTLAGCDGRMCNCA